MRLDDSAQVAAPGCTRINRPIVHTIYPPVAEAYFLGVHYLSPAGSGTTPIQAGAALCAVLVTVLLLYGLPKVGRDRRLAVLWAWCPTVALEAGNNGHVDVLAAGITAAALILLARPGALAVRGRASPPGPCGGPWPGARCWPWPSGPRSPRC